MSLNELDPGMDTTICRTDSRFRPDIRKLEQGDIDGAAIEKTRLEEKQRDASKQRKSKKSVEWSPRFVIDDLVLEVEELGCFSRWFQQGVNPHNKQDDWLYKGDYWKREYNTDLDIF